MPAVGFIDHRREVEKVLVGKGEGDNAEDMDDARNSSAGGLEAL